MSKKKKGILISYVILLVLGIFFNFPIFVKAEKYLQTITIDNRQVHINIPDNVSDASPVIVYFHGMVKRDKQPDNTFIDNVSVITQEISELRSVGQPVVLIAPSGEIGGENGCWGGMTSSWLNKAIARAKTQSGKQLSKIVLAGHSCGYGGINKTLGVAGVYKVILLDAMYPSFSDTAANKNIVFASISTNHGSVSTNTAALFKLYFQGNLDWNNKQYVTSDKRVAIYTTTMSHMNTRNSLNDLYLINKEAVPQAPPKKVATVAELEGSGNKKTNPLLSVQIPGLGTFSPLKCTVSSGNEGYCNISWIGEYISALYDYGVKVVAILAVIMIMVGGWRWIFAGGNASRIGAAKKVISGAIIGLILMLTSYMLLELINPNLVTLNSLSIEKKFYTQAEIESSMKEMSDKLSVGDDTEDIAREFSVNGVIPPEFKPDPVTGASPANPFLKVCNSYPRSGGYRVYNENVALQCKSIGDGRVYITDLTKVAINGYNTEGRKDWLARLSKAAECVKNNSGGWEIIGDGYRSPEGQYITYKKKPALAAKPCCSNHGVGSAFDLAIKKKEGKCPATTSPSGALCSVSWNFILKYEKCFLDNGLMAKMRGPAPKKDEPWHWSHNGG